MRGEGHPDIDDEELEEIILEVEKMRLNLPPEGDHTQQRLDEGSRKVVVRCLAVNKVTHRTPEVQSRPHGKDRVRPLS